MTDAEIADELDRLIRLVDRYASNTFQAAQRLDALREQIGARHEGPNFFDLNTLAKLAAVKAVVAHTMETVEKHRERGEAS